MTDHPQDLGEDDRLVLDPALLSRRERREVCRAFGVRDVLELEFADQLRGFLFVIARRSGTGRRAALDGVRALSVLEARARIRLMGDVRRVTQGVTR